MAPREKAVGSFLLKPGIEPRLSDSTACCLLSIQAEPERKEKTTVVYDTNRNWHLHGYIQVNCVNTEMALRTEQKSIL